MYNAFGSRLLSPVCKSQTLAFVTVIFEQKYKATCLLSLILDNFYHCNTYLYMLMEQVPVAIRDRHYVLIARVMITTYLLLRLSYL